FVSTKQGRGITIISSLITHDEYEYRPFVSLRSLPSDRRRSSLANLKYFRSYLLAEDSPGFLLPRLHKNKRPHRLWQFYLLQPVFAADARDAQNCSRG